MRLISSFCALACVSALPLAAVAQTAAETPAPETAPDTAGRTVLDVTASGTLTGLAADALGPDAALTVRLHGPVAFDVDTADFASLEIFADDPAVKLTVSDTAAYDRITAVSIPAAASGEPAAAAFTVAAASAGIATLADTAGDGETIPNHLSVNVKGNVSEISGTSSASGLAPWRFNNSEWVNTTGDSGSTITVSGATFKVASVGGNWSLSSSDGMDRIASQISRLGAMGDGYRDGEWTVEASNIPYDEYSLILYLATDNESKVWSRTKLIQGSSETYYYYADEDGQRILKSTDDDGTTWGTTTDIATDGKAAYVGRDIMVIPGLSGSSFTFNLDGTSGKDVKRGGLFGFQVVKSRDIKIEDNVADAQLSSFDVVGDKNGYLTDAFVTATLGAGSTLTVDAAAFYHLKLKGPETGTATLQIAADVDFSKIDLSEATNVNIKLVAPQEGGNTPLAVTGSLQASGDVTISTPVTLTVDGADVTPYWSVGGTLTIADGGTLTVDAAEGVTLPNPYRVIQANTISVASGGALATPDGSSYKAVLVGSDAVWVISNNSIWPAVPVETQTWTDLRQEAWVTEGGGSVSPVQITTESSVVLELANGATLTVNDSILNSGTVSELALRVTDGGTATITVSAGSRFPFAKTMVAAGTVRVEGAAELGAVTILEGAHLTLPTVSQKTATSVSGGGVLELGPESATETEATVSFPIDIAELIASNCTISGSTLTVADQVTVAAGTVELPKDTVFAASESGTKPVLEIAGGATAVVDAANTTLVQRNTIRGTNANATLRVTNSSGYNLRGGEILAGDVSDPLLDNVRLEVPEITASHAGDPWLRNATIAFTGGTSTWTADNWVKADGTVTVEVPEGSTVTFDTRRAFWLGKLVKTGAGTFAVKAQNIPIEVREGRLELTWWDSERPTDGTTVAKGAILAMASADTMSLGNITGNGTIEITGSATVSGFRMEAGEFNGTLRVTEGVTKSGDWTIPCNVELNGTAGAGLTVGNGYTLSGTGTVAGTLTFEGEATLDASAGVLTVGGLVQPDTGTVTVKVAGDAAVEDAVLKLSSGTADALAAAQFTVAERDTLRVAASGSDYVLALRMPTDGEASVTVTKPDGGSSVNWSALQWTVGGGTYPSAAAGATNALTLALPEGVTVAVDETITAKSLTVKVVDGNDDGQVTEPATLLLRDDEDLAGIAETLTVTAPAVLQVPCTGTAQQIETMDLAKVRGSGVLEISGVAGATCSALGLSTEAGVAFGGTLRIAEGVTTSGDWTIPCNVELNGTVSGTLTVPNGKRFGGSGTVTGQLKLENGYILKCGASAAQVPLIGTEVGEGTRVFDTSVPVTGGRLWRDTAKEDFILRLAKIDDYDPAFIANSSGYVVDPFTENEVSGLRLAAAFELDLSDLRDPVKTSGTYAWDVADNWLAPGGGNGVPGADDVVRIMVPADRNVTVVIPPNIEPAVRAIQVIGMTGEAAGWKTGTLRWVEGTLTAEKGSEELVLTPSATLSSTLTTQEIRMAGPMEITQECNVSVKSAAGWTYEARIGSGAAHCSVWIKAGTFEADNLLMENVRFAVGGATSTMASVTCDLIYLQTQADGKGLLKVLGKGSIVPSSFSSSSQDSLELAGGTFTVPASGMKLSDQIVVSADSTLHFAGTDPTEAILSFAADAQGVGFSDSGTLTLTGTGTLDASDAKEGSEYTGHLQFLKGNQVVCNIGQRRPTIGGAPYRIEVVRKASGEESEVRIPLYGVFVIPPLSNANATAGVAVSGWVGTVAKIDRSKTPADLVLTPLGYPQLEGGAVPGISGEAAMVLRKLASSGNRNFTVRQEAVTGKPVEFDAEGVNAALLLFTNVAKKETNGSVTVAYAFGISDITVEGDDIIVTAKVLGPEGAAGYASGAHVNLYLLREGTSAQPVATAAGTTAADGSVTLEVTDGLTAIDEGSLKFIVKAADAAETPVTVTPEVHDSSVGDDVWEE